MCPKQKRYPQGTGRQSLGRRPRGRAVSLCPPTGPPSRHSRGTRPGDVPGRPPRPGTASTASRRNGRGSSAFLRHKIVDHIRRASKDRCQREQRQEEGGVEQCFTAKGHWKNGSCDWGADPAILLEKRDFWKIFEQCFAALPQPLAHTFALREMEDRRPADVCESLDISESNLWVRLHRARVLLKECLDKHWFKRHTT